MLPRQAKILTDDQVGDLLVYAGSTRHPQRNRLIVLLSVKAGLRAGEIAGLSWDMVLGGGGSLRSGSTARSRASTSATAIASMIETAAEIQTAHCTVFVIEKFFILQVIINDS